MKLSILIPTLERRKHFLVDMLENLNQQSKGLDIEILVEKDNGQKTTGEKRNNLLKRAKGEYVWFVDDDDYIFPGSLKAIYDCLDGVDVIGINGIITTNGANQIRWEIRLNHPYDATTIKGELVYRRFPNHITPMRRDHAIKIPFPHITMGEDYKWACALRDSGLLKTEKVIDQNIYHYKYITHK
jgi:glycosyltransferase involved in cell wall biosynthesis